MILYRGVVRNGVVIVKDGLLPEGATVDVQYSPRKAEGPQEPFNNLLMRFAGTAKGVYPSDYARNHDHYLYGTPKREAGQ